jgi:tetratricopeptide (TPR) repeat protein
MHSISAVPVSSDATWWTGKVLSRAADQPEGFRNDPALASDMTMMDQDAFEQTLRGALACLNAGDVARATEACTALRQAAPEDPAVLQLHATIAMRTGQPAEAWGSIRRALAVRPGHVPSLILAGHAALEAGLPGQAVPQLREAIARAPDHPQPAFLLCRALLVLGDPSLDAALAWTADKHPSRAAEWQQLGVALQRAHRQAAALAAFTRAAAADPKLAAARFGRGLLLRDAGRMQAASSELEDAVALDPAASGAWFALGLTRQDLNDEAGAAAAFQAALAIRADFAEAAVNLGIALQRLGDITAAMDAYRTAVRIRPDTFGRIAQALTSARTGMLWLSPAALRRALA